MDEATPAGVYRRLPGVLGRMLVVAAAAWFLAPTAARAQIDYSLSNTSAVFNGTTVLLSGSFTVQTPSVGEWLADIQVTPLPPFGGPIMMGEYSWGESGGLIYSPLSPISPSAAGSLVAYRSGSGNGSATGAGSLQISFDNLFCTNPVVTGIMIDGIVGDNPTGGAVQTGRAIYYNFSSDASAVFSGERESISGDFGFDPITDVEYGANISLSGPMHSQFGSLDAEPESSSGNVIELEFSVFDTGHITFANKLSSAPDPLSKVDLGPFSPFAPDTSPTGFACTGPCPVAVPEPTSLAILCAALGLFLLSRPALVRIRFGAPIFSSPPVSDGKFRRKSSYTVSVRGVH
jgi:hypothetical protein